MSQGPKVRFFPIPRRFGNGGSILVTDYVMDALLASESHWRTPGGGWSGGGPFYKVHQSVTTSGSQPYTQNYFGSIWSGTIGGASPISGASAPRVADMIQSAGSYQSRVAASSADFATGWARTRPGNPTANVGQFIIELRDFPALPGKFLHGGGSSYIKRGLRRKFYNGLPFWYIPDEALRRVKWFQGLGSEYLNVVFGWEPFVKDLQSMYNTMKNIDKQMAQIVRDNGRGIKRGTRLDDSTDTDETSSTYNYPFANIIGAPPAVTPGKSRYSVTTTTSRKSWYSAKYQYYIPDTNSWQWNARARAALFGALPTPGLLWEVLPWSWMVDWFSNVGDVVSNMSENAVDNLVAPYSYIMTSETYTKRAQIQTEWASKQVQGSGYVIDVPGGSASVSATLTKETKMRAAGSPYGLGVSYSSLNARQVGVLAALGMSRSRF